MGYFAALFAAGLVVAQTTLMLLYTEDSSKDIAGTLWTFSLVRRAAADTNGTAPWAHVPQRADAVLAAWNPNLLLQTLCSVHLIVCLSRAQRKGLAAELQAEAGGQAKSLAAVNAYLYRLSQLLRMVWVIPALAVLTTVVAVLGVLRSADTLRYPTILLAAGLYLGASWYAYLFDTRSEDLAWTLAMHLQLVSVPLTVLAFAAMGVRFWTDVALHASLLSAAVNALWLQHHPTAAGGDATSVDPWARQIARLAAVVLPIFCVQNAQAQWGSDGWEHVTALLASVSLAPLLVLTVLHQVAPPPGGPPAATLATAWEKIQLRVAHLCISVALLSLVVNLATMT